MRGRDRRLAEASGFISGRLDSLEAQIIPNTEGAVNPFFSPDGQWVGFFAGGKIQKVSVSGGAAVTLADAPFSEGASWGSGGNLAFAPINTGAIQQVPEEGGAPQPLTQSDQNELSHRWPEWLLEGQAVLFAVSSGSFTDWTNAQIDVQAMETENGGTWFKGARSRAMFRP